jgi:hypothetical protein
MTLLLLIAGLLAAYVVVCWLLAFLRNMAAGLGRAAAHRLLAWLRRLREWRAFAAAHRGEFAGPQFRWPPAADDFTQEIPW